MISDIRQAPQFFDVVADRIWRAWWEPHGHPLAYIVERLRENMAGLPIPFALVAHEGPVFQGTVSVIASDLAERPQYSPWAAALWVDPEHRRRGLATALLGRATAETFARGFPLVYLCAVRERRDFYRTRGFARFEEDVGEARLDVFVLERPA